MVKFSSQTFMYKMTDILIILLQIRVLKSVFLSSTKEQITGINTDKMHAI
jgi:ABC-type uncharacterized transport system permease subunit